MQTCVEVDVRTVADEETESLEIREAAPLKGREAAQLNDAVNLAFFAQLQALLCGAVW